MVDLILNNVKHIAVIQLFTVSFFSELPIKFASFRLAVSLVIFGVFDGMFRTVSVMSICVVPPTSVAIGRASQLSQPTCR